MKYRFGLCAIAKVKKVKVFPVIVRRYFSQWIQKWNICLLFCFYSKVDGDSNKNKKKSINGDDDYFEFQNHKCRLICNFLHWEYIFV